MRINTQSFVWAAICLPLLVVSTAANAALSINATFNNAVGETWTATRMGVINEAISNWESKFDGIDDGLGGVASATIDVSFDFTTGASYLGQYAGGFSAFTGDNVRPWSAMTSHTIHFNADLFTGANTLWWDPTPTDDGSDKAFADWDGLTVARHEIGHMLGFTTLYVDDFNTAGQTRPWLEQIDASNVFDPGGFERRHDTRQLGPYFWAAPT